MIQETPEQWKVVEGGLKGGDLVRLKSGGPLMTIMVAISPEAGTGLSEMGYLCKWFETDENGNWTESCEDLFCAASLEIEEE